MIQFVKSTLLEEGMLKAKSIYDKNGKILLRKGNHFLSNGVSGIVLTLPMSEDRGILATRQVYWLTSPFLVGRSASYGYAITHPRAEHIVL